MTLSKLAQSNSDLGQHSKQVTDRLLGLLHSKIHICWNYSLTMEQISGQTTHYPWSKCQANGWGLGSWSQWSITLHTIKVRHYWLKEWLIPHCTWAIRHDVLAGKYVISWRLMKKTGITISGTAWDKIVLASCHRSDAEPDFPCITSHRSDAEPDFPCIAIQSLW